MKGYRKATVWAVNAGCTEVRVEVDVDGNVFVEDDDGVLDGAYLTPAEAYAFSEALAEASAAGQKIQESKTGEA